MAEQSRIADIIMDSTSILTMEHFRDALELLYLDKPVPAGPVMLPRNLFNAGLKLQTTPEEIATFNRRYKVSQPMPYARRT